MQSLVISEGLEYNGTIGSWLSIPVPYMKYVRQILSTGEF